MPTDLAHLWKSNVPGVELFEARLHRHRFGKHFHEAYTIGLNESGQGCCQHRGETHVHSPGSFNLINPGDIHTGQVASDGGWGFRNIYIDFSVIDQIVAQLDWPGQKIPYFKEPVLKATVLRPVFYQLFQALASSDSRLTQQSLLLVFLSQLFQLNGEKGRQTRPEKPESTAVVRVRSYLQANYAANISLDDLACLVNLSPYYLIRCFRRQVGCAPHQYQRHWQLVRVKQVLSNSNDSLAEIATTHGFYDQSHLNRAFKQTYGVTPGQYRKGNSVQYGDVKQPLR